MDDWQEWVVDLQEGGRGGASHGSRIGKGGDLWEGVRRKWKRRMGDLRDGVRGKFVIGDDL